jgi:hypothetical protein
MSYSVITTFSDYNFTLFLISWGGVRLSPLGTSATNWPIVPAPDDRWWWWMWSNWWNENWQGKPKYSEKTYPSATSSTTDPTWLDLGSNLGRCGGKPAANPLSCGRTTSFCLLDWSDNSWLWCGNMIWLSVSVDSMMWLNAETKMIPDKILTGAYFHWKYD